MSEPERLSTDELRSLFLFDGLDDDQLGWLAANGRIVEYPAGATIHAEGAPASCFLVLLSGTLAMSRRVQGGELELMRSDFRGSYTGAFDFYVSEQTVPSVYPATAARRDATAGCSNCLPPFSAVLSGSGSRWQSTCSRDCPPRACRTRDAVERHERLVALGAVTAGLTHELNNPVAAVMRASGRLREMLAEMREKLGLLVRSQLPSETLEAVADMAAFALESSRAAAPLTPIEASDREDEVADWLTEHDVTDAWDIAPTLVSAGLGVEWLDELTRRSLRRRISTTACRTR